MKQNSKIWESLLERSRSEVTGSIDVRSSVRAALEARLTEARMTTVYDALVALFDRPWRKWMLGGCVSAAVAWASWTIVLSNSLQVQEFDDPVMLEDAVVVSEDWSELL